MNICATDNNFNNDKVNGKFMEFAGERFYAIENVDKLALFLLA